MKESPLLIKQIELGPMQNYIYVIADQSSKEACVIDPAWDVEVIDQYIKDQGLNLTSALITHGHPDHTNGINKLLERYDIPVYVSKHEAEFYKPIGENIKEVDQNSKLEFKQITVEFVHTPGHTPGSQCFFVKTPARTFHAANDINLEAEHILVSGDTLFLDGCGRCDLPGGDVEVMHDTLSNILMKLPQDTVIFPGHNYHHYCCDSLKNQQQTNPYLQAENLQSFINKRAPRT